MIEWCDSCNVYSSHYCRQSFVTISIANTPLRADHFYACIALFNYWWDYGVLGFSYSNGALSYIHE
jgi:asparagine N-glycosylation enzyme membrane subunit Stt3